MPASTVSPPQILTIDFHELQKFVVAKVLHGGMGTVYQLVPVRGHDRVFALKTLQGTSSIRGFDIECDAWFSVAHHPNIARAFAFGTWNSLPSVLIDWYDRSLADFKLNQLSLERVMHLLQGTVEALRYAYVEQRLIHQDIKPPNILVDQAGNPRLSDFGLARCIAPTVKTRQSVDARDIPSTITKELSGTPFYMAPELWAGAAPSISTDIFSLGVTFFQLLTGRHPYATSDSDSILSPRFRRDLLQKALHQHGESAKHLERLIERCVSLEPSDRYMSYDSMLEDLLGAKYRPASLPWTLQQSEIVAGTARFYSIRANDDKASRLLTDHLSRRPDDPILLQALARAKRGMGRMDEAASHLFECYMALRRAKGVYEDEFVPAPLFGWANYLIQTGRLDEAARVVQEAMAWSASWTAGSSRSSAAAARPQPAMEIGWLHLFNGDFSAAQKEILECSSRRTMSKLEAVWLVESAWLAGTIDADADDIAVRLIELTPNVKSTEGEREFAWCRMLLHQYANPRLADRIWKSSPSYLLGEAVQMAEAAGLERGALLLPKSLPAQGVVVDTLDKYATGGKHHEHIRSIST